MDQLDVLRTFMVVADRASFAEAARRLNISPTTATRTIAALEASLGVSLLVRTTRSVRLTEEGAVFLERARAAIGDLDDAVASVRGGSAEPLGTLVVTAPVVFGRLHILPIVVELLQRFPKLDVRLLLLDRVVRMVEEGVDIAVRIADLHDSALQMLRIGEVRRVLTASPTYLDQHGEPADVDELSRHSLVALEDELGPQGEWRLGGGHRSARISPRLSVNSVDTAVAAAIAGLGIIRTLSYQVAEPIAAGSLRPVMEHLAPVTLPISLLFQGGQRNSPNVRAFVDAAKRRFERTKLL